MRTLVQFSNFYMTELGKKIAFVNEKKKPKIQIGGCIPSPLSHFQVVSLSRQVYCRSIYVLSPNWLPASNSPSATLPFTRCQLSFLTCNSDQHAFPQIMYHSRASSWALQDAAHSPFQPDFSWLWLHLTYAPATQNCLPLPEGVHPLLIQLFCSFCSLWPEFPFPSLLNSYSTLTDLPKCHLPIRSFSPAGCDPVSSDTPMYFQVSLKALVFHFTSSFLSSLL